MQNTSQIRFPLGSKTKGVVDMIDSKHSLTSGILMPLICSALKDNFMFCAVV